MAAAITLTIGAAIILSSGHYLNNGFPPPGESYCSLLGRLSMAAAVTLTMGETLSMAAAVTLTIEAAIIYGSGRYPNDWRGHYLWQRPLT